MQIKTQPSPWLRTATSLSGSFYSCSPASSECSCRCSQSAGSRFDGCDGCRLGASWSRTPRSVVLSTKSRITGKVLFLPHWNRPEPPTGTKLSDFCCDSRRKPRYDSTLKPRNQADFQRLFGWAPDCWTWWAIRTSWPWGTPFWTASFFLRSACYTCNRRSSEWITFYSHFIKNCVLCYKDFFSLAAGQVPQIHIFLHAIG